MAKTSTTPQAKVGSEACRSLVFSLIDDYTAKLITMVETSDHGITIKEIHDFLATYKAQQTDYATSIYANQYEQCQLKREQEVLDRSRRQPFQRVIGMRLNRLFPTEDGLTDDGKFLSRRLLKGLFTVLEKMAGEDALKHGHTVCMGTLETLRENGGGSFVWEDLYRHADVVQIIDDVLLGMTPHLINLHKRAVWMRELINNNLGDADLYEFEGPEVNSWQLDERGTFRMLRELYAPYKPLLSNKNAARKLVDRHSPANIKALVTMFQALDSAEV